VQSISNVETYQEANKRQTQRG